MTTRCGRRLRRSAAAFAIVLAASVLAGTAVPAARASATAASQVPGAPPAASAEAIEAALGVKGKVPAEFVFLVDESDNGVYNAASTDLPGFLSVLAANEPQDHVDVITFSREGTVDHLYGGPPPLDLVLPNPQEQGSPDLGQAFDMALTYLGRAARNTRVGALVLLSDNGLDAAGDPGYLTPKSPGWAALAAQGVKQQRHYPAIGYDIPLSADPAVQAAQEQAFQAVFAEKPTPLPASPGDLGKQLSAVGDDVLAQEVTTAANKESDQGVRITWTGLPPAGKPLNFRAPGHLDVQVHVSALTARVPLYLTDIQLSSPGLPFAMSDSFKDDVVSLVPGAPPRTYKIHLTWQQQSGSWSLSSTGSDSGRLVLTATVGSTFTPTLVTSYHDTSFAAGTLHGAVSTPLTATTAATDVLMYLLLLILVIVVILIVIFLRELSRAMLAGTLRLTTVDQVSNEYPLPRRRRASVPTNNLIGIPGRMTVRKRLFSRNKAMHLTLELANRPTGDVELKPGGRAMAAGIDIVHSGSQ